MGRSYIRSTLIAAVVLVQMTAYAQTGASSSVSNNAQVAADAAKTADIAKAQAEKAQSDNSAAQNSTSSATANQDQKASTGDSTSVSGATAQAPSSVRNEVVIVSSAPQTVEQPTTVVTAAPLAPSRAEDLRKARERAEVETEQGIVEKLERDRLEDETKRRDELFQARKKKDADLVVVAPVLPVPAPAVVSAPAAQVVSAPTADTASKATVTATSAGDNSPATATATITSVATAPSEPTVVIQAPVKSEAQIRDEITASIKADMNQKPPAPPAAPKTISVGGILTTMSYPDAYNTYSDFGAGVSIGWMSPNRISVEGSFLYSQHTIDDSYSLYKKVDQQNWAVAARYNVLPGTITPVVGALMSYTRRDYTDMYDWGYQSGAVGNGVSSDAIDVGLILGAEFMASKNIVLGVDYRYVTNLTSRYSDDSLNRSIYQSSGRDYRPLEEIDYEMVAFSFKFLF